MSLLTVTHNFVNGTTADADQVDTNFTDVKNFVDTHLRHDHAVLGYAEIVANSNTVTTLADITGMTVTVSVVSGRRYKITVQYTGIRLSVATDEGQFTITDGSNVRFARTGRLTVATVSAGSHGGTFTALDVASSTGSKTYKVRGERITGTGNVSMEANSDSPSWILVEDIGPSS